MPDAIEFDPAAVAIALADLRAAGDHEAADALLAAATPAVAKSMGELAGSAGGFLVPPAAAVKRKRKRKLRGCVRKALADLED